MSVTIDSITVGQIASQLGEPIHKILYVIGSRRIDCDWRAGQIRMYGPGKVNQIAKAIESVRLRTELTK